MFMREEESKRLDKSKSSRIKRRPIMYRTPLVTCGLVGVAIVLGIAFYAQGGLLFPTAPDNVLSSATEKSPLPHEQQEPQGTLQKQETEVLESTPAPAEVKKSAPSESIARQRETNCDLKAKITAETHYNQAIATENKLHQKNLHLLDKLMSVINKKPQRTENNRHNEELNRIKKEYQKALVDAGCTS